MIDKFLERTVISPPMTCWLWTGGKTEKGYGLFFLGDKTRVRAHRFSYEYFIGAIPNNLLIRHTCDNPSCVNPNHLLTGTAKQNTDDMLSRGRARGASKALTREHVKLVMSTAEWGTRQQTEVRLAAKLGVNQRTIRKAWSGK